MGRMKRAVYPGSFDVFTNGHMWVTKTAAAIFDELIMGIGVNTEKRLKYMFPQEERARIVAECTKRIKNVKADLFPYDMYWTDYARSVRAKYILRGIRDEIDLRYETKEAHFNSKLAPEIVTIFLPPPAELSELSSSFVKDKIGKHGWEKVVKGYVPKPVYDRLLVHKLP